MQLSTVMTEEKKIFFNVSNKEITAEMIRKIITWGKIQETFEHQAEDYLINDMTGNSSVYLPVVVRYNKICIWRLVSNILYTSKLYATHTNILYYILNKSFFSPTKSFIYTNSFNLHKYR